MEKRKRAKLCVVLSTILMCLCAVLFVACATTETEKKDPEPETPSAPITYVITFRQEGFDDIQKTVKEGEGLTDIPSPNSETGYTIVWDTTDFTNIKKDITINAVKTANTYTITYSLGVNKYAKISANTLQVTFGSNFTLNDPIYEGTAEFKGWYLADANGKATDTRVESGTYAFDSDITIIAVYEEWSEVIC